MKLSQDSDPVESAARLKRQTYSPLCGLVTSVGYSLHPARGPHVRVNGGELTGMHALLDRPDPKPGSYHIGGVGLNEFEAEIKVYAEAVERYCAGTGILNSSFERRWATRQDLAAQTGDEVLDLSAFGFAEPTLGGPFDSYSDTAPLTWVKVPRVGTVGPEWVPAQFFYLGYNPRRHDGEPWLGTAVTARRPRCALPWTATGSTASDDSSSGQLAVAMSCASTGSPHQACRTSPSHA